MAATMEPLDVTNVIPEVTMATKNDWSLSNGDSDQTKPATVATKVPDNRFVVTIEPVIFLFMFAIGLHGPAVAALTYHKVCIENFANQRNICDNLHNETYKVEEDVVQTDSAHWFLYQTLCFELPAIVLSFFYGSLSDHFSRRLALALPLMGQIFSVINYIISAVYLDSNVAYILIGHLISGLFGGWITCCLAAFSYLSEVSSESTRTWRIAIAEGVLSLSISLSYFVSGLILDNTSFVFVFSLSACLYFLGVVYTFVRVKEPPRETDGKRSNAELLREVCSIKLIKDSLMCIFKKRDNNNRKRLLWLLTGVFTTAMSYMAMYTLGYLYLKRQPLSWSQTLFGYYVGILKGISGLALFILVPLMKNKLHMRDTSIVMVAIVSTSASELLFGLSTKDWMVFLVPFVGVLSDVKMTCMRALLSLFVEKVELGKMFAAVGSIQSLSGIMGSLIFNYLYPVTLSFWPGFSFSVGVMLSIIPFSIIWWLHRELKRDLPYARLQDMVANTGTTEGSQDVLYEAGIQDDDEINHYDVIDITETKNYKNGGGGSLYERLPLTVSDDDFE